MSQFLRDAPHSRKLNADAVCECRGKKKPAPYVIRTVRKRDLDL